MEKKEKWKERINYIKCVHDDGRVSYTGVSINYSCVCSSWKSVEDLQRKSFAMIQMWLKHGQDSIQDTNDLEMKECTPEEWEAKDDNIDWYEIERMKRILSRPTVREKFKQIISIIIADNDEEMEKGSWSDDVSDQIIDAMINCEN